MDMNDLVKQGYNKIAKDYTEDRDQFKSEKYLKQLSDYLKPGSEILDVGCGGGKPVDAYLVEKGYKVIGFDISEEQIKLAQKNVPDAEFEVRDMSELKEGEFSVDVIVSFYAIFHTPRDHHQKLLELFYTFLRKNGYILLTMGAGDWEGEESDFHGEKMYWSHFGAEKNRELFEKAGFEVILDEIDISGGERHQILIGRKK